MAEAPRDDGIRTDSQRPERRARRRKGCIALLVAAAALSVTLLVAVALVLHLAAKKNVFIWLPAYIRGAEEREARRAADVPVRHVIFALVDHFEPPHGTPGHAPPRDAMADWMTRYPELAARHRDSDGRPPRHTFAYPIDQYREDEVAQLVALCRRGLGEIEVQFHHGGDTSASFRAKMLSGLGLLAAHGVCKVEGVEGYRFGFVHGNFALDNALGNPRTGVCT